MVESPTHRGIQRLLRRGDLDSAISRYVALVEANPADWTSVNALGDLYARNGNAHHAIAQFTRAADHFHAEGFLPKAAALYRKILKLRHDDHALLNLIDIAAAQGLLAEAKQHLVVLERQRRAEGNTAGADECLTSLEAIVKAIADPRPRAAVESSPAAPPPPVGDPRSEDVGIAITSPGEDRDDVDLEEPAEEGVAGASEEDGTGADDPEAEAHAAGAPVRSTEEPRTLEAVFGRLRETAEQETAVAAATRRFARAQQHLRDGEDAEAVADFQAAAHEPVLRFWAASALGRLYLSQAALHAGIAWLERAAAVPPTDRDEASAVLYELADALEQAGEAERALVTFMKLDVNMGTYRDSRTRIARLLGVTPPVDRA
jgi:tetratricopeptide (TPR) repeat protein